MTKAKPTTKIRSRKVLLFAGLLVAIIAVVGIVSVVRAPAPKNDNQPVINEAVTMKGKVVCLPHKNTGGPHTLECAIGLQNDNNKYYALKDDDSQPGQSPLNDVFNKRVEVTGIYTQTNDSVYDIAGTITLSKLKVLE